MSELRDELMGDLRRKVSAGQRLILIALRLYPNGLTLPELREAVGASRVSRSTLWRQLKALAAKRLVSREDSGAKLYRVLG